MFLSIIFRQWKRVCSCFFRNDEEDLHGLDSITTSFLEQTEMLAPFQTFRPAATEEEQTELLIPFLTFLTPAMEEGADGALHSVLDLSRTRKQTRSGRSCLSRFGPPT